MKDLITVCTIGICVGFIAWLFHRELRTSRRVRTSLEKSLEEERNALEQRISRRTREFIASEEARMREIDRVTRIGELSRGLLHDLMNPLTTVSLHLESIDRDGANPREISAAVRAAVEASRRMGSFMNSIKSIISPENGEKLTGSSMIQADCAEELAVACDLLAYKARMAGVALATRCPEGILLPVHPVRLQQVFLNLISNAIEACEASVSAGSSAAAEHRVEASVTAIPRSSASAELHIIISDTGCGVSGEDQDKLFRQSFTTKPAGTGIGLTTVRSIIEKDLGGRISFKSSPGKGARCILNIPLPAAQEPPQISG